MDKLNSFFQIYDSFTAGLPKSSRLALTVFIMVLIIWQLWLIIKKGRWIFLIILVILIPAIWPLLKDLGHYLFIIFKFLITRIGVNI